MSKIEDQLDWAAANPVGTQSFRYTREEQQSMHEKIVEAVRRGRIDAILSRHLALAIGYLEVDISESYASAFHNENGKPTSISVQRNSSWQDFSFRDPLVIYPIAAHYNCFPCRLNDGKWMCSAYTQDTLVTTTGESPEEAIVSLVIAVAIRSGGVWKR